MSTILLLDDDAQFSTLVASLLERRKHTVFQARTGARAKEAVSCGEVDLAIVDYRLPDIDGVAWITWLRELGAAIPVIFLSGFSCDNHMLNRLRNVLSVPVVLKKPLDPLSFAALVDKQLNDHSNMLKRYTSKPTTSIDRLNQVQDMYLEELDRAMLRGLTNEYLKELPSQILKLADAINGAFNSSGDSALAIAICEAHRLRGTTGSYGLKNVSEMMGTIEDCLLEIARVDSSIDRSAIWSRVEKALRSATESTNKTSAEEI